MGDFGLVVGAGRGCDLGKAAYFSKCGERFSSAKRTGDRLLGSVEKVYYDAC